MNAEHIIAEVKAIPSTLSGEATDAQVAAIMYITRDAFIKCGYDDNPVVEQIWGDERVTELSKADAARFIGYFGDKDDEGEWGAKRVEEISVLHRAWQEEKGQLLLFELE